ncbi:MAG: phage tail protein, partial [Eubacteriales bacterium]|nr:phage tail protein [Eubacteriales bacterium]
MADDFGLKIGVEGEKEFKNALRDINQSFKVLASEMNLVSSQFDKNDKSIQSLAARNQVLNKEIDAQKDKITTLQAALQNATDSFGENDKRTQAWAVQLNNAKADLNGMERELSANEKALDDMGEEEADAAKETDKLGDELKET